MRYFITGGAGFIGSNYIEYLVGSELNISEITVYDKFTYAGNIKNLSEVSLNSSLRIIEGDICDIEKLQKQMSGHDVVVNFAAESHVDRSILDASKFIDTNVIGSFNVMSAAAKVGVKTLVQISTDEVYGSLTENSADEFHPLLPNSPYAASKAGADLLARSFFVTHGLDVRVTRCCNNFGKYQYPEKVIPAFITKLAKGDKVPIYGDGKNVREWIHVIDHCKGIQKVIQSGTPGEIYNIGSGIHLSNIQLANKIIQIMGESEDQKEFVSDRKGHDFRYSVNSEKIHSLGFSATGDFESQLEETIVWYLSNLDWWH